LARILIVDDSLGAVHTVRDPDESHDIVLLDLVLHKKSDLTVLEEIRTTPPTTAVTILSAAPPAERPRRTTVEATGFPVKRTRRTMSFRQSRGRASW
jgi:DNA-binding response OmpR family regulator